MKKGILMLALALASITVYAQRPSKEGTPEQRAEKQTQKLTETLKLTEAQQKKIYTLNLERATSMEAMRKTQEQNRSKMKESNEAFKTNMNAILTAEQQEQLKAIKEEGKGHKKGARREKHKN